MKQKIKWIITMLILLLNLTFSMTLLWDVSGKLFSKNSIIGVCVLSFIEIAILYKIASKAGAESELMANRLNSLVNKGDSYHVLLDTDSPNFELSKAINRVESYQKKRNIHYQVQNNNYLKLIEHLTVGVMQIDHKRQVLVVNDMISELLGQQIESKQHSYIDDIKTYKLSGLIEKAIKTQEKQRDEVEIENTNRIVDATVVYVSNNNVEFQVIVILYDITELKLLERIQNEFVGNVSHELKTPVTAIKGFAETLLEGPVNPDITSKFLNIIYDESEKLEILIQEILKLAKGQKTKGNISSFNLDAVINYELDLLSNAIKSKNLIVVKRIKKEFYIKFDRNKIATILGNLLQNAVKYNVDNGRIVIEAGKIKTGIFISISDTGIGISNQDKKRIFERFYRVDPSRNKQIEGNGLGLAIVQELVVSMGGKISVKDSTSRGTKITIYLQY